MAEIQIDHTAFSHTSIRAKDVPVSLELATIRRLNPDNPQHVEVARRLDIASPEVINPYTGDHTPMTEEQLKRWIAEEVYVISLQRTEEPVGYVYLYPDEGGRLSHIRKTMKDLPHNARTTEFNFWAHKDVKPEVVESALRQALARFFFDDVAVAEKKSTPTPPRFGFMYVEPGDTSDATLLKMIGGQHIGDISYDAPGSTEGPMDMVYLVDAAQFTAASRATSPTPSSQEQTVGL